MAPVTNDVNDSEILILRERLRRLEEAYQEAQRLSLSNDYAAAVMHEVNNPLEAITNLVYLAQHESNADEIGRYLGTVQEQLLVLAAITRSSLAFYKGQAESREINLMGIAESALKLHFNRLRKAKVRVQTEYCSDAECQGVASEILQVISNLILNAVDAMADTSNALLRVRINRTGDSLQISVTDNGPGIPIHMEHRLFEAHASGKKTGMGMGLWLSKKIAAKHGGTIRSRTSRKHGNSGTVFSMRLPASHA